MKTINVTESQILELASELAHEMAKERMFKYEMINSEDDMFINNADCLIYTDVAQTLFNQEYDHYLSMIEKILK